MSKSSKVLSVCICFFMLIMLGAFCAKPALMPEPPAAEPPLDEAPPASEVEECGTEGLDFILLSNGTYAVCRGSAVADENGVIVIPASYEGIAVTEISDSAFYAYDDLREIKIPESVTRIGKNAFAHCNLLLQITLPNRLCVIGEQAFFACGLREITVPDHVTEIGDEAFSHCTALKTIKLGRNLRIIGRSAFEGCKSLLRVSIPDRVTSMGESAFRSCESLRQVVIGDALTVIPDKAFGLCRNLTVITFGDNVLAIGDSALSSGRFSSIVIPDGVVSIGANAFHNLDYVVIPRSIKRIGRWALWSTHSCTVYFCGTEEEWTFERSEVGYGMIYFYSEDEPTSSGYWHYVNGEPEPW